MSQTFTLWKISDVLSFSYRVDTISKIFLIVIVLAWIAAGVYSLYYMKGKDKLKRYYIFYIALFFIMCAMAVSANLFTYYANYELMTLFSAPLVMHDQTKEARMAGFKYMMYSFFGAYFVLFGFSVLNKYCDNLFFLVGGTLNLQAVNGHEGIVLLAVMSLIIGFGVKAGMWPFHAWLTAAHPIAVSPASAVLSGVIVKAGVTGIIRVVYYLVGADFIRGTWVQKTWLTLSLLTILMGSTLAYFEPVLKRRLAYSTISNASYILFGLALLEDTAYEGALLQFVAHAFGKVALFLIAGVLIHVTGTTRVDEMQGVGKKHPVMMWCYIFATLSMIGIPPTGGFLSKWFLMNGSIQSEIPVFFWLGPVILLISALLTAGYLLPLAIKGFIPGDNYVDDGKTHKLPAVCIVPIVVMTLLGVLVGIVPTLFVG